MVPPQINKFYFYDLSPKKSLIRFALESGLQTFTLSWRNPTEAQRDWNFTTYISAIDEAIGVISEITGSPDCNIEGGCIGGATVVGLLGDYVRRGERKVNSATFMVTMLDTSVESQLGNLATPSLLEIAKVNTATKGVMKGSDMGLIFAMLRPNDLIWNYWVNNYLMGKDPPTFDVLAWNADTTRMAAGFHLEILDMVKNNTMANGTFKVHGQPIQVGAIDCDQFWMAGTTDHITPWQGCYSSMHLLGGQREFVLSDGGHIQSMVSSPNNPKAKFHVNPELPKDPEAWLAGATEHKHSWWLHWRDWITQRSGDQRPAPSSLGSSKYQPLTDAPGTYVFE
jgi:polyhydroxyalkanoate synthase